MKFGMLLPHFGAHFSRERIVEGSQRLEELGYDSVWVRDHLVWKPHGMEGTNRTFVEAFITLAAVAGATKRIGLGTGVVIPIRWPLKVAHDFASLSVLSGREVEAGFGVGSNPAELGAAGFAREDRMSIFAETVEICRRVWTEDDVTFRGEHFAFDEITIEPKPIAPLTTWYGGTTRGSVRRAVAHCDGWLPGRVPMATLDDRLALLRELNERDGRSVKAGVIPVVSIDEDRHAARANIDIPAMAGSSEGSKRWIKPPSGEFRRIEDLEGLLVSGTPEDCVEQIKAFEERGVETFIFDLRLQFDRYEEKAELIAREVLPRLRVEEEVTSAA
jgi:alkanesulfonate monooxygenase SsuD/methylene tetrahydromethanopterin reductase-like flavin-dependent oxidoreductase (luciferase family)